MRRRDLFAACAVALLYHPLRLDYGSLAFR